MAFVVAIFWDDQIKRRLATLKTKPGSGSSLPLAFMTSTASVATMLSSATPFFLHLTKLAQVMFGMNDLNQFEDERLSTVAIVRLAGYSL